MIKKTLEEELYKIKDFPSGRLALNHEKRLAVLMNFYLDKNFQLIGLRLLK